MTSNVVSKVLKSGVLIKYLENNPFDNGHLCLEMFTVADVNSDQFSLIAFFNCLQKTFVL